MELYFVTENKHKFSEMKEMLAACGIKLKQKKMKLQEPDLASQEEVALTKAKQAFAELKRPLIVEDTGVYFNAYRNFPGHLAKRIYESIGFDGLIALIKAAKNKRAYFKTVICYVGKKGKYKIFSGEMRGRLIERVVLPKKDRLPYEKIFVPEGFKKAVVQLSIREKNKISHRAKATTKLGKWLSKR